MEHESRKELAELRDEIGALPAEWDLQSVAPRPAKVRVTIRLDRDVETFFRQQGAGWQPRLNQVLRAFMILRRDVGIAARPRQSSRVQAVRMVLLEHRVGGDHDHIARRILRALDT